MVLRGRDKKTSAPVVFSTSTLKVKLIPSTLSFTSTKLIKDKPIAPAFSGHIDHWLYAKAHCKYSTWTGYISTTEKHLKPLFSGKRLDEIQRQDVVDLINTKLASGLTKATVKNIIAPLREMFNHAMETEPPLVTANPVDRLGRRFLKTNKKKNRLKINPLTREEVVVLLDAATEHYDFETYVLHLAALRAGLRMGELFGLEWGALDFNSRFIEVRRTSVKGRVGTPKNHQLRRVDVEATCRGLPAITRLTERSVYAEGRTNA